MMAADDLERVNQEKETTRLEAFSDGVFAIAITLLVLELKVPRDLPEGTRLADALAAQWPSYLAFLISFMTIGVMWINHHRMMRYVKRSDHWLLVFNALLLLGVTIVPFPTELVAEYIGKPDANVAAMVYCGIFEAIAIFFQILWLWISHNNRLLDKNTDPRFVQAITRAYIFGPVLYLVAFGLAIINAGASIGLCMVLAIFFAIPGEIKIR